MSPKKKPFYKKVLISFLVIFLSGTFIAGFWGYRLVYQPNVSLHGSGSDFFYIRTGSVFSTVLNELTQQNLILNPASFQRLSELKGYNTKVKPGRYRIRDGMSNNQLINLLRAGLQEPVQIVFNNIRTKNQLVSRIGKKLEADSLQLLSLLNRPDFTGKFGFNTDNILTLFIPNTYEIYWNTSAEDFMERMDKEYKSFWTSGRKNRARELNLSAQDVSILASIVQAEQNRYDDEKPVIAGLYLNRLKSGMPLQSDPTLIYAAGDFSISRVLNSDKNIESLYNTYRHSGLPPGPICLPEISSIDAVLNFRESNYFYMCAKEDFSGRHHFAETIEQHKVYAKRYREALDKHNIKR